ncbi:hypothetical protein ACOME3_000061 [Neoechinorhynchus agilis]
MPDEEASGNDQAEDFIKVLQEEKVDRFNITAVTLIQVTKRDKKLTKIKEGVRHRAESCGLTTTGGQKSRSKMAFSCGCNVWLFQKCFTRATQANQQPRLWQGFTVTTTVTCLRQTFAGWGFPEKIGSDKVGGRKGNRTGTSAGEIGRGTKPDP